MARAELAMDLASRFAAFADISSRFSREIVREMPEFARMDHEENVKLNLRVSRTIFGKWSLDILSLLYTDRTVGFQEMRRELGRITPRVLSNKLTRMEELGLVRREVLQTKPPRVQYSLTEKGLRVAKLGEPVFLYLRMTENLLGTLVEPSKPSPRAEEVGFPQTGDESR